MSASALIFPIIFSAMTDILNDPNQLCPNMNLKNSATDASQGVEKILSPSFKITRDITDRFAVDVEYIYTKNTSDAQSRNYTSHLTSLEFSYSY